MPNSKNKAKWWWFVVSVRLVECSLTIIGFLRNSTKPLVLEREEASPERLILHMVCPLTIDIIALFKTVEVVRVSETNRVFVFINIWSSPAAIRVQQSGSDCCNSTAKKGFIESATTTGYDPVCHNYSNNHKMTSQQFFYWILVFHKNWWPKQWKLGYNMRRKWAGFANFLNRPISQVFHVK